MAIRDYMNKDEKKELVYEQKTGAEIGRELGITRMAVSNTLKRAMTKVFDETKKLDKSWNNFEAAVAMSQIIGVDQDSAEELKKFFKLFPPKVRSKIEADGAKLMPKK